jgi:MoaA/NifB/PqqE/SkfB family radical SAM enzyme
MSVAPVVSAAEPGEVASPTPGPTGVAPVLQLHPTRRCNLACAHCYTDSSPQASQTLPLGLLTACLDDAWALGYRQLAVSGGEPLVYGPLRELLQHARGLGFLNTLTTNAMLATPARWAPLAPWVDGVAVSIDGTPAEHDALRGQRGAFDKALAGIATLRDSGVPFGLIFTLTQFNVDSLEAVVRLAARQGARSVQVHPLSPSGRAAQTLADACPDGMELLAALAEAARLASELGVAVLTDVVGGEQLQRYRRHLVPRRPVAALCEVAPVLVVQADGSVLPLTHEVDAGLALGSLRSGRLDALSAHWLACGHGNALARACEQTWRELAAAAPAALDWWDEVAARTRPAALSRTAAWLRVSRGQPAPGAAEVAQVARATQAEQAAQPGA